jgi:hypothetical protein
MTNMLSFVVNGVNGHPVAMACTISISNGAAIRRFCVLQLHSTAYACIMPAKTSHASGLLSLDQRVAAACLAIALR